MKNFFKKFGNYSFWISLSAALVILINALGRAFGFSIENQIVEDCVMSIAGILVVLGIVTMNDTSSEENKQGSQESQEDLKEENKEDFDNQKEKQQEKANEDDKTNQK